MTLINYVITSSKLQAADKFLDWIKSELTDIDEREIMSLAQQWVQQGVEKGVIMGRQEGKVEGRMEEREDIAKNMLYQGHSVETVVNATSLPFDVVQQLSDDILVH